MSKIQVPVKDLQPDTGNGNGDFLVGLDNGYVVEVEHETDYISLSTGSGMSGRLPDGMVLVTFHDENGDENYLIMPGDSLIYIERN